MAIFYATCLFLLSLERVDRRKIQVDIAPNLIWVKKWLLQE